MYARLSEAWDTLFPPDTDREQFILERLSQRERPDSRDRNVGRIRVVDVGCGTGATALALASSGYSVLGTDLDSGMIEAARGKTKSGVDFRLEDMLQTAEALEPGSTDALLCLGNTLPHLENPETVGRFFSCTARGLRSGGFLLVQVLDYRRIINAGSTTMPELTSGSLVFRRRQAWNGKMGRVEFSTDVSDGGRRESRSHLMLPLTMEDLQSAGDSAGLRLEESGGCWSGVKDPSESGWLYLLFRKDS